MKCNDIIPQVWQVLTGPDISEPNYDPVSCEKMLSLIRHEWGNTVNAAMHTLEIMGCRPEVSRGSREANYLERLEKIVARQHNMVLALKAFGRISAGSLHEIEIHRLWRHILKDARTLAQTRGVALLHHILSRPIQIMADAKAVTFILEVFLRNAIESLENHPDPHIHLSCFEQDQICIFHLEDNGGGLRGNEHNDIFLPLYSTKPGHDGMGLCLARKLASEMNGRIGVSGRAPRGACFQLQLNCVAGSTSTLKAIPRKHNKQ